MINNNNKIIIKTLEHSWEILLHAQMIPHVSTVITNTTTNSATTLWLAHLKVKQVTTTTRPTTHCMQVELCIPRVLLAGLSTADKENKRNKKQNGDQLVQLHRGVDVISQCKICQCKSTIWNRKTIESSRNSPRNLLSSPRKQKHLDPATQLSGTRSAIKGYMWAYAKAKNN